MHGSIKAFLSLNKSEQRGIIVLICVIIIISLYNIALPYISQYNFNNDLKKYNTEINSFLEKQKILQDSANIEFQQNSGDINMELALQKIVPHKFNPNKLPVDEWKKMGFTDKQISNIKKYEAKGGKFKRKEDVKKMYSISDVEYAIIEPYINIPSSYKSNSGKTILKTSVNKKLKQKVTNINSASVKQLEANLGLSSWLAKRTIAYKNALGGYFNKNQLKEVYGLNDSIFKSIEEFISIDTANITKIDINNIEFKQLLKHPYVDYNTTKLLLNTRNKIGSFSSINQLFLIDNMADSTINKINGYVVFR